VAKKTQKPLLEVRTRQGQPLSKSQTGKPNQKVDPSRYQFSNSGQAINPQQGKPQSGKSSTKKKSDT